MASFDSAEDVERDLEGLTRGDDPFVARLARRPGQKEQRWTHLLGDEQPTIAPDLPAASGTYEPRADDSHDDLRGEVEQLREELELLRAEIAGLKEALGL